MRKSKNNMITQLLMRRPHGARPLYTEYHLRKALDLISKASIGRGALGKELGLGKGSARTIVKILKASGLIKTSKKGCELTKKGQLLSKKLHRQIIKISEIEAEEIAGEHSIAVLVRNVGNKVKYGVEQRDAAIITGAAGATTIIYLGGKLRVPTISEDFEKDYPQLAKKLLFIFKPRNNDVIVIGSACEEAAAERGAEVAAYTLIGAD